MGEEKVMPFDEYVGRLDAMKDAVNAVMKTPEEVAAEKAYAQALIDQADAEVRRMAKKAGVPDHAMARAVRDFARELVPHAGRQASVHSPSHWKRWWRGYAAGMRAMADKVDASVELSDLFGDLVTPEQAARALDLEPKAEQRTRVEFVPTHQMMVEGQASPQEALHFLVRAIEGDMEKPSQFRIVMGQVPSGTWCANAEWVEPGLKDGTFSPPAAKAWRPAPGDGVQLKGGNDPRLLIVGSQDGDRVHCTWRSESGREAHDWFDLAKLEPA